MTPASSSAVPALSSARSPLAEPVWTDFEASLASFSPSKRALTVHLFKQLYDQVHTALHDREVRDHEHRAVSEEIAKHHPLTFANMRPCSPEGTNDTPTSTAIAKTTPTLGASKPRESAQIDLFVHRLSLDKDAEGIRHHKVQKSTTKRTRQDQSPFPDPPESGARKLWSR
jgi:hypothetical protein